MPCPHALHILACIFGGSAAFMPCISCNPATAAALTAGAPCSCASGASWSTACSSATARATCSTSGCGPASGSASRSCRRTRRTCGRGCRASSRATRASRSGRAHGGRRRSCPLAQLLARLRHAVHSYTFRALQRSRSQAALRRMVRRLGSSAAWRFRGFGNLRNAMQASKVAGVSCAQKLYRKWLCVGR